MRNRRRCPVLGYCCAPLPMAPAGSRRAPALVSAGDAAAAASLLDTLFHLAGSVDPRLHLDGCRQATSSEASPPPPARRPCKSPPTSTSVLLLGPGGGAARDFLTSHVPRRSSPAADGATRGEWRCCHGYGAVLLWHDDAAAKVLAWSFHGRPTLLPLGGRRCFHRGADAAAMGCRSCFNGRAALLHTWSALLPWAAGAASFSGGAAKGRTGSCKGLRQELRRAAARASRGLAGRCKGRPPELQRPIATAPSGGGRRPPELQRPIAAAVDAGRWSYKHRTSELQRPTAASGGRRRPPAAGAANAGRRSCNDRSPELQRPIGAAGT